MNNFIVSIPKVIKYYAIGNVREFYFNTNSLNSNKKEIPLNQIRNGPRYI